MPAPGTLPPAARKALTDALGTCHLADVHAQFLEVIAHPGAEEAIDRFRHVQSTVAAGLEFERRTREGEI